MGRFSISALAFFIICVIAQGQVLNRRGSSVPVPHYVQQGTITGNGSATQSINTHLITDIFIYKSSTAQRAMWKTSDLGTDSAFKITTDSAGVPGYFTISDSTVTGNLKWDFNQNGVTGYWIAMHKEYGKIGTITWTGTGAAHSVVGKFDGVKPYMLVARPNKFDASYTSDEMVTSNMTGDSIGFLDTYAYDKSAAHLGVDSLWLSGTTNVNDLNQNGTPYIGWWVAAVTDSIWLGSYVGNATAGRAISFTTKTPQIIFLTGNHAVQKIFWQSVEPISTNANFWIASAEYVGVNLFQSVTSSGVTLGSINFSNDNAVGFSIVGMVTW